MMVKNKRIILLNNLVEEIYRLCLKCNIDWFYQKYYKKKRKTIEKDDISDIYFNILDLGLDISEELHQWFKINLN